MMMIGDDDDDDNDDYDDDDGYPYAFTQKGALPEKSYHCAENQLNSKPSLQGSFDFRKKDNEIQTCKYSSS